jgi:acyl-CoA dehydrogenase
MNDFTRPERLAIGAAPGAPADAAGILDPCTFSAARPRGGAAHAYLAEPAARKLAEFFEAKGLLTLKAEDRRGQWYADWVAYQARHGLYATVLSPRQFAPAGSAGLDLLRLTRFLEVFGYFSPAHGYSLQVTFLGLFSILMGTNDALKREAVAALKAGGLLAMGASEQAHGSDLLANEFTVRPAGPGRLVADGRKYYIGNSNAAAIISVLARRESRRPAAPGGDGDGAATRRAPPMLFALRPASAPGFRETGKIHTLGVRAAHVGAFEVRGHEVPAGDVIAEGRGAWDALFGAVTLGKFFLGFGAVGLCEHALAEAAGHLARRVLYSRPALDMPHLRATTAQAYARLAAMKLYAYRALDYVRAATAADRRYLLYCAVQKAKVSTEGVKVIALLSECVGANGFESDTYFETALRDVQLIPPLEGSTHVNLAVAAGFIPRYFGRPEGSLADPPSLAGGETDASGALGENPYLMEARTGAVHAVAFPHYLSAYRPLASVSNVRALVRQARAFRLFLRARRPGRATAAGAGGDTEVGVAVGRCLAAIVYAQLVAENAARLRVPLPLVSAMFHLIVGDLSASLLALASLPRLDAVGRALARRAVAAPWTTAAEWDFVSARVTAWGRDWDESAEPTPVPPPPPAGP